MHAADSSTPRSSCKLCDSGTPAACSEQKDDPDEVKLQEEMRQYGDILRVDVVDTYGDLSMKTLKTFATMPGKIDADFYFKVDDDVAVNVAALTSYLQQRRTQGNLYLVSPLCCVVCKLARFSGALEGSPHAQSEAGRVLEAAESQLQFKAAGLGVECCSPFSRIWQGVIAMSHDVVLTVKRGSSVCRVLLSTHQKGWSRGAAARKRLPANRSRGLRALPDVSGPCFHRMQLALAVQTSPCVCAYTS